ncbi:unnamed protein product [Parajaminaea phylloscopi]
MAAAANMWAPVGSPGNGYGSPTRGSANHTDTQGYSYEAEPPSPSPSGNSRRNRFSAWFSRSRSGSPNTQAGPEGDGEGRSRSRGRLSRSKSPNEPASPGSFVVRNVVRQTGGVSWDQGQEQPSPGSTNGLEYRRSKSKPIGGMTMSLGVPPGGPGGGTGYGTATSPNDGRPVQDPNPMIANRYGRSRSQSPAGPSTPGSGHAPPERPVSPGHTKASAFQRPHRVSPGPMSWNQQHGQPTEGLHLQQGSDHSMQPPRPPFAALNAFDAVGGPPASAQRVSAPRGVADKTTSVPTSPVRTAPRNDGPQQNDRTALLQQPGPRGSDGHSIPGFDPAALRALDSSSPLNIPTQSQGADQGRQSGDHKAQSFGFVGGNDYRHSAAGTSPGTSPGIASRLRGFFAGTASPGGDDSSDDDDHDGAAATPYGVSASAFAGKPAPPMRKWSGQHGMDPADLEARMLRKKSQREAARLVDEERRKVLDGHVQSDIPTLPSGIARELTAEGWTPEVLDRMTDDGRMELVRRLTVKSQERGALPDSAVSQARDQVKQDAEAHEDVVPWDSLTPAQKIIAETRSRHLESDRRQAALDASGNLSTKDQQGQAPQTETPVRRESRRSPTRKAAAVVSQAGSVSTALRPDKAPAEGHPKASMATQPASSSVGLTSKGRGVVAPTDRKEGLSPGSGPLPKDFGPDGLMPALQDMMTRFYRFERYSVPLLRSLEARLVDIERDAQMAQAAAPDGASDRTGRTQREQEMDRWVGQMASLIKHEIGQLKAGTREIREGREMLASLAKSNASMEPRSHVVPAFPDSLSAVPTRPRQLSLPPGTGHARARDQIAQDRHQVQSSQSHTRSTSPSGRPQYTSKLGLPLARGIAPSSATWDTTRKVSTVSAIPSVPSGATIEAEDDDDSRDNVDSHAQIPSARQHMSPPARDPLRTDPTTRSSEAQYPGSPTTSEGMSSTVSSSRGSNARSVNDRLKALVKHSDTPSASGDGLSPLSSAKPPSELSSPQGTRDILVEEANLHHDNSRRSQVSSSSTVVPREHAAATAALNSSLGLNTARQLSGSGSQAVRSNSPSPALTTPAYPTTGLLGGRTSPSPASYAGLAVRDPSGGMSNGRLTVQHSGTMPTSPTLPILSPGEEVNISARHASAGLRARAKSYLTNIDGNSEPTSGATTPAKVAVTRSTSPQEDVPPPSYVRPLDSRRQTSVDERSTAGRAPSNPTSSAFRSSPGGSLARGPSSRPGGMTLKERVAFFEVASR